MKRKANKTLYNTLRAIPGEKIITIVEIDWETKQVFRESTWDMHTDGTVGHPGDIEGFTPDAPTLTPEMAIEGITNLFHLRCHIAQQDGAAVHVRAFDDEIQRTITGPKGNPVNIPYKRLYGFRCVAGRVSPLSADDLRKGHETDGTVDPSERFMQGTVIHAATTSAGA